jgi:hypothetical protein
MRLDEISNQNQFILKLHKIEFEFKKSFGLIELDFHRYSDANNLLALYNLAENDIKLAIDKINDLLSNLDMLYDDLETQQSIKEIRDIKSSLLKMFNQIMKMK